MEKRILVYKLVSLIPRGKVLTYSQIAKFLRINSPRLVGQILHQNPNPKKIPCHRVVFSDGNLSKNYAFGRMVKQEKKLYEEGVKFYLLSDRVKDSKVNLKKSQWQLTKVLKLYFTLFEKFGDPGPWPWFGKDKAHTKEEIVIGAILTQNTNWSNVKKALDNLRKNKVNSLKTIYQLGKENLSYLKSLIHSSGFYNQKTERLLGFCQFIIKKYQYLNNFFKLSLKNAREQLLSIKGIGEETADTILLYAGEKPIFVVDAYTVKFARKYFNRELSFINQTKRMRYQTLQKFFMNNLPVDVKLFQNYHALIIAWGKNKR